MLPALSSRPIKGATFLLCVAAHAVALLMLAQAGIPGAGPRKGTAANAVRDMLVPVKLSPLAVRPRRNKTTPDSHIKVASPRTTRQPSHKSRPQKLPLQQTSTKSVSPIIPLLANPLGQGSWGLAKPSPAAQNEMMLANIQQAHAALRMALMDRLSVWMGQQMQQHQDPDCLIRLSLDSRQAHLSCTPRTTEGMLWPALSGVVVPGDPSPQDTVCIEVRKGRLGFANCSLEAGGHSDGK